MPGPSRNDWNFGGGQMGDAQVDPAVADLIATPDSATSAALAAVYTPRTKAAEMFARLSSVAARPTPAVSSTPATVTWRTTGGNTTGMARVMPTPPAVSLLAHATSFSADIEKFPVDDRSGPYGIEFIHSGSAVEFGWSAGVNPNSILWLWVDGEPLTAAPINPSLGASPGDSCYGHLDFGSYGTRRVTVYATYINAWLTLGIEPSGTVTAAPQRPRIAVVGDSFCAGSDGTPNQYDLPPFQAGLHLGAEVVNAGIGGTGYTTGGNSFGSAARIALAGAAGPLDALVFVGSVNDGDSPDLTASATACFAAYAEAFPGVPVIVLGPQQSNAPDTTSAVRASAITKIKAACDASPNVIGFYDMVGTLGGAPPSWQAGQNRTHGERVTALGAVWTWDGPTGWGDGNGPGQHGYWRMLTWDYWGNGSTGSPTGLGSRDVLLYRDGVHPMAAASRILGRRVAASVRDALHRFATSS